MINKEKKKNETISMDSHNSGSLMMSTNILADFEFAGQSSIAGQS
jgi:hypothetical protein